MLPDSTSQNSIQALLMDEAWLRRLARGLVGEADADDLTQDVLIAAIKAPPRERGIQLRAWAKTVARRMAMRRGGRDRTRQLAEQGAARPEDADQQSEQRLLLHRRLTDSILSLKAPYRTVLVMRYLEEQKTAEIAERLQITPTAARTRISRGLAKLREILDGEFGDRGQWMNALGPMAFGAGWQGMLPAFKTSTALVPASVGALTPVLALLTMKKLLVTSIVLCVALLVGVLALQNWLRAPAGDPPASAFVQGQAIDKPLEVDLVAKNVTANRDSVAPAAQEPAGPGTPQIHLVDSQGKAISDGVGAWVDTDMQVHILEFDEAGQADLPEAALGSMCLVRAPGLAIEDFLVESVERDVTVTVRELVTLYGRLLVDGVPAVETMEFECAWSFVPNSPFQRKGPMGSKHIGTLESLDLVSGKCWARLLPGGRLEFEGVQPLSSGHIALPKHLKVLPEASSSWATFESTSGELYIEATGLPHVKGQLVWADDRSPYTGWSNASFTDRKNGTFDTVYASSSRSGEFSIALEYLNGNEDDGLKHVAVRVRAYGEGVRKGQEFTCLLEGDLLQWDMGILPVERTRLDQVLVVNGEGLSIPNAFVMGSQGEGRTNDQGLLELPLEPGELVGVLAMGFLPGHLDVDSASVNSDGQYVVALAEGVGMRIHTQGAEGAESPPLPAIVRLYFPNELVDSPRGVRNLLLKSLRGFSLSLRSERSLMVELDAPPKPIELPGLIPGAVIKAEVLDVFRNPLLQKEFVVRSELGTMDVELVPRLDRLGTLEIAVVDEFGQPLGLAKVEGVPERGIRPRFYSVGKPTTVHPLALGEHQFVVTSEGRASKTMTMQVVAGKQSERVVLYPGRDLAVQFQDEQGREQWVDELSLLHANGRLFIEQELEPGQAIEFSGVPQEPMELLVRVGTRTFRRAVDADQTRVEPVLPSMGKLRVHFEEIPQISAAHGRLSLFVDEVSPTDTETLKRKDSFNEGANGAWDMRAALHPGEYQVQVRVVTDVLAVDRAAVTRALFEGRVTIIEGEEALITISAGENPTATLTPR